MPNDTTAGAFTIPILPSGGLSDPFGQLGSDLSDSELRETAYEIFVGVCRSTGGGRPLTYVSQSSGRTSERSSALPSLQRSLTSTAASKVKKALGMKSSKKNKGSPAAKESRPATVGELMRVQMRISEQIDSRVRRALLRIAAAQLGRRIESIVLPVELLQQFKSSDFATQREYESWQRRNLKVLETGLLLHPKLPLDNNDPSGHQLQQIVRGARDRPIETGKHSEAVQTLRTVATRLAGRSTDGYAHWADGPPLNLRLYRILLEALFDVEEPATVIEEVDEVLELVKKTWVVFGIDERLHNLCFSWVLFDRYVSTGQVESDLLSASHSLLLEVKRDAKSTLDSGYTKVLVSTMNSMVEWVEKGLLAYHETFYRGNIDIMESMLSVGLTAVGILVEENPSDNGLGKGIDVERAKVDAYIRSSMRRAFNLEREKVRSSRKSANGHHQNHLPVLCVLAQDVTDLAFTEREIYSPVLRRWHPLAAGVAVATLHSCFGREVRKFVAGIGELTPGVVQVLIAADKVEKDLVRMAVEDAADSEDGGTAVVREMTPPYEAAAVIAGLVKTWIKTRVERLEEWAERNLQQEAWDPRANRERLAPSAVEVLRTIDETLEAFFLLPIPMHPDLLPELMSGLDRCLQDYVLKAKAGSGSRSTFLPTLPSLTRCGGGSTLFKKKERPQTVPRKKLPPTPTTAAAAGHHGVPQLCVRINTLHYVRKELDVLEKRTAAHLQTTTGGGGVSPTGKNLDLSSAACVDGIRQLSQAAAYKLVFRDLGNVLWDSLYAGGDVAASGIGPFLRELERQLEVVAETVRDNAVRTRVVTDVMKASFEGFLLVLLAGGPGRSFITSDAGVLQRDFRALMDLFWSDGDGLPSDLIEKYAAVVKGVLPLFSTETESLIERFKSLVVEDDRRQGVAAKHKLPLPPTSGQWGPDEPNTVLRVLCYRNDKTAATFLKKTYDLPKKL